MRARLLRGAIAVIAVMAVGGLAHVWIHLRVLQLAYDLARETRTLEEVEQTSRKLRTEIAYLKSPERLEQVAHERLQMVPLDPTAIRVVRHGRAARAREHGPRFAVAAEAD